MLDTFQQHLQKNGFTQLETEQLRQSATLVEIPARHLLLHQNDYAKAVFFLLEGICHSVYQTVNGKEFSKEFYWEDDWIIGFESLINKQPSAYLLRSVTRCTLLALPIEILETWRQQKRGIYLKMLETQLMHKESKERFMLLYTAQERYALFCQEYPSLLDRLSDYQIAAYLGITPISLSRIKKRHLN